MSNGIPASTLVDNFRVERKLQFAIPFELIQMFPSLSKRLKYRRNASFKEHILMLEDVINFLTGKYNKFCQNSAKIQEEKNKAEKEYELAKEESVKHRNISFYPYSSKSFNVTGPHSQTFWLKVHEKHQEETSRGKALNDRQKGMMILLKHQKKEVSWQSLK